MNRNLSVACFRASVVAFACLVGTAPAESQGAPGRDDEALLRRALETARAPVADTVVPQNDWMTNLVNDPRARAVNDLLTIQVVETIQATGTADARLSKASDAGASVSKLFGLEKLLPDDIDPTNLLSTASKSKFDGAGATTRTAQFAAVVTARVIQVLSNGDLVLEGAREIDINGDRQVVVLTGLVRQADISPNNVVLSTSIAQLRIRYYGQGLIKDSLKPGWLIRIFNKIF
jgi:flagellar L-ring protein precursor FlgH